MSVLGGPGVVGRVRELRWLDGLPRRLAASEPARFVLEGEAGIGKTVLWESGVESARAAGMRVLTARATAAERGLPFSGLADLAAGLPDEALDDLPTPQRTALDAALLRSEVELKATDQLAVCFAVFGALRAIAPDAGVVIAIDDLQWLDEPTARVLGYALRRTWTGIGLLAAVRTGEDGPGLAAIEQVDVERLPVGPLGPAAIDALLRSRVGRQLTPPVLARLVERVHGNPLHALELARALPENARLVPGERIALPDTLGGLLARRLAGLSAPTRDLLVALALVPRPSVVLGERLGPGLADALAAGILEPNGDGTLRFSHPLLAAAAADQVSETQRRAVHRRLAAVVEDREQRVIHLALGAEGPDARIARELDDATARAAGRGAPEAAAELAEYAARLTDPDEDAKRHTRLRTAALHHFKAGEGPRARALLEAVVAEQRPGPGRARSLLELATVAEQTAPAVALAEQALSEAGDDDALRAAIHLALASALSLSGDLRGHAWHAARAAELAEPHDPAVAASALSELALVRFLRGGGVQRELGQRAAELARAAGEANVIDTPLHQPELNLAAQLMIAWELDEARALIERRHGRERGGAGPQSALTAEAGWTAFLLTEIEMRAGRCLQAERHAVAAIAADASRSGNLRAPALFARARVDTYLGRVERARTTATSGLELAQLGGELIFELQHHSVLGFLALSLEDAEGAHAHLGPVVDTLRMREYVEPGLIPAAPDEIEALVALGQLAAARALTDELSRTGERLGRRWAIASAHRGRALVAAAEGKLDHALAASDAALSEDEHVSDPFGRARTLLVRGAILRRAGRRGPAREALERARALFDALPAPLWSARAEREARRLGGRRAAPPSSLTPTEERIAALAADGRTNREIAAELFITVKTVETNMSRIFRKLGLRSRTELARRSARP